MYDSSRSCSKTLNRYCFRERVLWQNQLHLPPSRSYPSTFLNLKRALLSSVCNVKVHPETMETSQKFREKRRERKLNLQGDGNFESNAALSVCQGQTWIIKNVQLARLPGMNGFFILHIVIWLNMKSNCRQDARQNTKPIVLAESNGYGGWSCNGQRLRDENSGFGIWGDRSMEVVCIFIPVFYTMDKCSSNR